MKDLLPVGFFKETHPFLERGGRILPSFVDFAYQDSQDEHRIQILNYLRSGHEHDYISSRPIFKQPADRTTLDRVGFTLTDGVWVWPAELAYYVDQFKLVLPTEFVTYMSSNNWTVPRDIDVDGVRFPGTKRVD